MHIDNKTIFVAGGTGLAGSAVVRRLLALSSTVRVRVPHRSDVGMFEADPRVEYVQGDLTDQGFCLRVAEGCDMAVMAAAFTAGALSSNNEPWRQVTTNVIMDSRMLEAFHLCGIRRVVYVSTASVYQDFDGVLREEDLCLDEDPPKAYMGVGWTKRYGEKACQFWHENTGMEILIARLANVYGPGAKFSPDSSHFVAAVIRKICSQMDPLEIWGSPDVVRDILYVDDFGEAVATMLEAKEIKFDIFNIGSGRKTDVGSVVSLVLKITGQKPSDIRFGNSGVTTAAFRALDCSKAHKLLGWKSYTGVEEGLRQTVNWWQENKDSWAR